jgi:hypothetical protein
VCSPALTSENSWPPEQFEARQFTAETVYLGRSGVTDLRWQGASVLSDQGYTHDGAIRPLASLIEADGSPCYFKPTLKFAEAHAASFPYLPYPADLPTLKLGLCVPPVWRV